MIRCWLATHRNQLRAITDSPLLVMPLKIELNCLVTHEGWKRSVIRSTLFRDGLIASSDRHHTEQTPSRFAQGHAGIVVMRP